MSNVFFTSDTHYMHRNIAGPKVSQWNKGYRDFNDEQEMSIELVKQINKHVKHNDILYHLGDWSFGGINNIWNFRKQINCQNIHLILGNHDHHIENNRLLPNIWYSIYQNLGIISTENFTSDDDDKVYAKDLFNTVQHVKNVKHGNNSFFLSHYAHRVWNKSHHDVIHLYGHSHASIDDNWGKSMDVGVDNAYKLLGEYRPFYLQEVLEIMNKREIKILDHHNFETGR